MAFRFYRKSNKHLKEHQAGLDPLDIGSVKPQSSHGNRPRTWSDSKESRHLGIGDHNEISIAKLHSSPPSMMRSELRNCRWKSCSVQRESRTWHGQLRTSTNKALDRQDPFGGRGEHPHATLWRIQYIGFGLLTYMFIFLQGKKEHLLPCPCI